MSDRRKGKRNYNQGHAGGHDPYRGSGYQTPTNSRASQICNHCMTLEGEPPCNEPGMFCQISKGFRVRNPDGSVTIEPALTPMFCEDKWYSSGYCVSSWDTQHWY